MLTFFQSCFVLFFVFFFSSCELLPVFRLSETSFYLPIKQFFGTCQLGQPRIFYPSVQHCELHLLEGPINPSTKHSFSFWRHFVLKVSHRLFVTGLESTCPLEKRGETQKKLSHLRKSASLEPKRKIQDVFVLPLTIQREGGNTISSLLLVWDFL